MTRAGAILLGIAPFICFCSAAENASLLVSAGDYPRSNVVVSIALPPELRNFRQLLGPDGGTIPLQVDDAGTGWFVVRSLPRGATAKCQLLAGGASQRDGVQIQKDGGVLNAVSAGEKLLRYQGQPSNLPREEIGPAFQRGGYIHPILTLKGKLVTDDYPPNHIHHHGLWWAWTRTEFQGREPDFWNMGQKKGRGEFVGIEQSWSGPVHGGFRAQHRFVDLMAPTPVAAINDFWDVRIYAAASGQGFWIFDLTSTQTCATADALKLPKYHYGGLGFRGNWAWNGKDKCFFLTSEGETDREKGNFTRGRWCDMWGDVSGAPAGVAILGHPENFGAPQPMRLHPTEPFFCFAPQQLGDMQIAPGRSYVSRYRFIVHDGPPDSALMERLWHDFAHPPKVELVGSKN